MDKTKYIDTVDATQGQHGRPSEYIAHHSHVPLALQAYSTASTPQLLGVPDNYNLHGLHKPVVADYSLDPKEEVLRQLGRALVKPSSDDKCRTPVVTISNTETGTIYSVLEKHLQPEYLLGADKFWKIVKADQGLDTWRPRHTGTQLKALLNSRLPETEEEFSELEAALVTLQYALRPDSTPDVVSGDLKRFVQVVGTWWDNRNKREGALKRAHAQSQQGGKRHNTAQHYGIQDTGPCFPYSSSNPASDIPLSSDQLGCGPKLGHPDGAGEALDLGGESCMTYDMSLANTQARLTRLASNPLNVVVLNVGGMRHVTTVATLQACQGSFFWNMLTCPEAAALAALPPVLLPSGEIFIDRTGKCFGYVLEYLRAALQADPHPPLPGDPRELQSLAREAEFYGLPGLLDLILSSAITPRQAHRTLYDSLYLETGFNSIEGPGLKEMEQRKVVVMQQMNHVLQQKQADGFEVDKCDSGVSHRQAADGSMQHNLFYHILLKKQILLITHRVS